MQNIPFPSVENNYLSDHIILIYNSFQHLLGYPLINVDDEKNLAERLFYAPFALLSHNTAADPLFNYANAKGLELFEFDWQELINVPSRFSAEPVNQAKRDKLLAQVAAHGFVDHYEGVRISKSGQRFLIRNAVVWNVSDKQGVYHGQAACFSEWDFL